MAQWVKDLGLSLCGSGHCCGTTLRELPHVVGAAKKKKKKRTKWLAQSQTVRSDREEF